MCRMIKRENDMDKKLLALDEFLEKLFSEQNLAGMAVAIRGPQGDLIYKRGFGVRNLEKGLPIDEDTVCGIASMSKSMVGLACCMLQSEGKLKLSDPMTNYFPDLHIPGIPDEMVTVEQVALHRAGLPPMEPLEWSIAMNSVERDSSWYREMVRTAPNKMDKIQQIVDYITKGDYTPLGMPGEYMSYSNEGYALLSYVVDQAAGIPLEEYLEQKIFRPLGMRRTVLDLDGSQARKLAGENMTSLFEEDEDGTLLQDDNWSVLPPFRGCACVKSTASDMTRYYKMLADGGRWEGRQVVPREAIERMVGRTYPTRKKPFYCMGLEKSLLNGKIVCKHSGGLHGVSSHGGFAEGEAGKGGYGITILCNQGDAAIQPFYDACFNYAVGLPLDRASDWAQPCGREFSAPEMLCGDFLAKEGVPVHTVVSCENGKLKAMYGQTPADLLYCGANVFAAVDPKDHSKRISTFRFYIRNGSAWAVKCYTRIYQRVSESEHPAEETAEIKQG